MALTLGGGGARNLRGGCTTLGNCRRPPPSTQLQFTAGVISAIRNTNRRSRSIVAARERKDQPTSKARKLGSKNRRSVTTLKEEDEKEETLRKVRTGSEDEMDGVYVGSSEDGGSLVLPELPGLEPDFWEGPQWDAFGFIIQYLWAFGVLFALIACGIAVSTYNEGATDFKQTPVYKESIQSRELLEEPEGSNLDVFESNPTEEAPSLE